MSFSKNSDVEILDYNPPALLSSLSNSKPKAAFTNTAGGGVRFQAGLGKTEGIVGVLEKYHISNGRLENILVTVCLMIAPDCTIF